MNVQSGPNDGRTNRPTGIAILRAMLLARQKQILHRESAQSFPNFCCLHRKKYEPEICGLADILILARRKYDYICALCPLSDLWDMFGFLCNNFFLLFIQY